MLKFYASGLRSMLADSSRIAGRSWMEELICRTLRHILTAPEHESLNKLRAAIDAAGLPTLKRRKLTINHTAYADVPCLEIASNDPNPTVIIYLHGGGYVFGSSSGYKGFLAQLAINNKATVIALDYRLSPEHRFPAAQQDCIDATRTILDKFPDVKLILAGDSAGGALALATLKQLRDSSDQKRAIDGCVLISPWVDPWAEGGTMISHRDHDFLTPEWLRTSIEMHAPAQETKDLLCFTDVDLDFLPPTLVQSGGAELFHDQICELVRRNQALGVQLTHQITPAQFHVFQLLSPLFRDSRIAVKAIAEFIDQI
jgi:acetyl esterase/lipase